MVPGRTLFILLCFVAVSRPVPAQPRTPPALHDVLQRAGAYVVAFQHQLAGIVAEERYVQDAFVPPQKPLLFSRTEHRELRSDLLLIKPPTVKDWIQFRDVFEVDGLPIRDRDERLLELLLDPTATGNARIEMRERYEGRFDKSNIEGVATYGRFRQFQVNTTETFQIKR
jgi:hypothetical protein